MLLNHAVEADYAAIIDLVNLAFRGAGPSASWNIETGIIEGQRLNGLYSENHSLRQSPKHTC